MLKRLFYVTFIMFRTTNTQIKKKIQWNIYLVNRRNEFFSFYNPLDQCSQSVKITSFGFKTNPNTILNAKLILTEFIN